MIQLRPHPDNSLTCSEWSCGKRCVSGPSSRLTTNICGGSTARLERFLRITKASKYPNPKRTTAPIAAPIPVAAFSPAESLLLLGGGNDDCVATGRSAEEDASAANRSGMETASRWFVQSEQQVLLFMPQHQRVVL